jgi:hypothetical protein
VDKVIVKIEKEYFQVYDDLEEYAEPRNSYSAYVNGIIKLPFAPFLGLEINNYGKIIQVRYLIEDAEFRIKVEKDNIYARTQAQLMEFNIENNFEGFVDDIAQWWANASLSVFGYGRSRRYHIKSGVATKHKYLP